MRVALLEGPARHLRGGSARLPLRPALLRRRAVVLVGVLDDGEEGVVGLQVVLAHHLLVLHDAVPLLLSVGDEDQLLEGHVGDVLPELQQLVDLLVVLLVAVVADEGLVVVVTRSDGVAVAHLHQHLHGVLGLVHAAVHVDERVVEERRLLDVLVLGLPQHVQRSQLVGAEAAGDDETAVGGGVGVQAQLHHLVEELEGVVEALAGARGHDHGLVGELVGADGVGLVGVHGAGLHVVEHLAGEREVLGLAAGGDEGRGHVVVDGDLAAPHVLQQHLRVLNVAELGAGRDQGGVGVLAERVAPLAQRGEEVEHDAELEVGLQVRRLGEAREQRVRADLARGQRVVLDVLQQDLDLGLAGHVREAGRHQARDGVLVGLHVVPLHVGADAEGLGGDLLAAVVVDQQVEDVGVDVHALADQALHDLLRLLGRVRAQAGLHDVVEGVAVGGDVVVHHVVERAEGLVLLVELVALAQVDVVHQQVGLEAVALGLLHDVVRQLQAVAAGERLRVLADVELQRQPQQLDDLVLDVVGAALLGVQDAENVVLLALDDEELEVVLLGVGERGEEGGLRVLGVGVVAVELLVSRTQGRHAELLELGNRAEQLLRRQSQLVEHSLCVNGEQK